MCSTSAATSWLSSNPPKDGTPIVAVGNIVRVDESEFGVEIGSEPFTAQIRWKEDVSGYGGWHYDDEGGLTVAHVFDDTVNVHWWLPVPPSGTSSPVPELDPETIAAPVVADQETPQPLPDWLSQFCYSESEADTRARCIAQPWSLNGHTWCTDGHIMLRLDPVPGVPDNPSAPRSPEVLWKCYPAPADADFHALPMLPPDAGKPQPCGHCQETGVTECQCCGSSIPCDDCHGQGKLSDLRRMEINGAVFRLHHLALLQNHLPGPVLISVSVVPPTGTRYLSFRFPGGDGVLMGIDPKDEPALTDHSPNALPNAQR